MKKAIFKMPEFTSKVIWYGSYGGHYDCMILFKEKPAIIGHGHGGTKIVDLWKEDEINKNIIGAMWPDEFEKLTGIHIDPEGIEVIKVHKLELTAPWNEDGTLWGYANNADGW